jgi:hypothetical protein
LGREVSDVTKEKIRKAMINRVVTWGDKLSEAKRGVPNLKRRGKGIKEIIQFDMNNIQIKEWKSISEASNTLLIPFNSISNNLAGYCKSGYGFIWRYKNEKYERITKPNNCKKSIIQFSINNEEIKKWDSITDASNFLSIPFNSISNNLTGYSKSGHGYIWKYNKKEDDK